MHAQANISYQPKSIQYCHIDQFKCYRLIMKCKNRGNEYAKYPDLFKFFHGFFLRVSCMQNVTWFHWCLQLCDGDGALVNSEIKYSYFFTRQNLCCVALCKCSVSSATYSVPQTVWMSISMWTQVGRWEGERLYFGGLLSVRLAWTDGANFLIYFSLRLLYIPTAHIWMSVACTFDPIAHSQ